MEEPSLTNWFKGTQSSLGGGCWGCSRYRALCSLQAV